MFFLFRGWIEGKKGKIKKEVVGDHELGVWRVLWWRAGPARDLHDGGYPKEKRNAKDWWKPLQRGERASTAPTDHICHLPGASGTPCFIVKCHP